MQNAPPAFIPDFMYFEPFKILTPMEVIEQESGHK
jgi:hypothetical protein